MMSVPRRRQWPWVLMALLGAALFGLNLSRPGPVELGRDLNIHGLAVGTSYREAVGRLGPPAWRGPAGPMYPVAWGPIPPDPSRGVYAVVAAGDLIYVAGPQARSGPVALEPGQPGAAVLEGLVGPWNWFGPAFASKELGGSPLSFGVALTPDGSATHHFVLGPSHRVGPFLWGEWHLASR